MDDPLVQCPYNIQHTVPKSRLQAHIVKCQNKYPKLKICPYNATHRMEETEFYDHALICPSKDVVLPTELPKVTGNIRVIINPPSGQAMDGEDEWDD